MIVVEQNKLEGRLRRVHDIAQSRMREEKGFTTDQMSTKTKDTLMYTKFDNYDDSPDK